MARDPPPVGLVGRSPRYIQSALTAPFRRCPPDSNHEEPAQPLAMGIKGLTKLLNEEAPGCIKEHELDNYTGRKVALDASMCLYQFMVSKHPFPKYLPSHLPPTRVRSSPSARVARTAFKDS